LLHTAWGSTIGAIGITLLRDVRRDGRPRKLLRIPERLHTPKATRIARGSASPSCALTSTS
jgi:hypothetical protein